MRDHFETEIQAREYLASHAWKQPKDYFGFSPIGDYLIVSQHRDSDSLVRSNYIEASKMIEALEPETFAETKYSETAAYAWSARHWAVGYVDYFMVSQSAPVAMLIAAANILRSIEEYPALNEDAWGELEYGEACDYWRDISLRQRVEFCREAGVSIFAARRADELPQDDCGYLYEMLRA